MDTLQSITVFRQVVEHSSFTRAADVLGISIAMASKHVRHLENHLQAKLLNRSSRKLSLTEAGEQYYRQCVLALDTLADAGEAARQGTVTAQGLLKITLPAWCATPYFARALAAYRQAHPQVRLSLHLDGQHTDLIAHGMDLALRVTRRPEPNLIVKPLTQIGFDWVASPAYIARHGQPQPENWPQHHGLLPNYVDMDTTLPLVADSNNTLMLYQLALAGMGLAYLPAWLTHNDIQQGRLHRINHDMRQNLTLYAAYMDREFLSAKVRSFIDFLAAYLPQHPLDAEE